MKNLKTIALISLAVYEAFQANKDVNTLIVTEDGNCFDADKAKTHAARHARINNLETQTVERDEFYEKVVPMIDAAAKDEADKSIAERLEAKMAELTPKEDEEPNKDSETGTNKEVDPNQSAPADTQDNKAKTSKKK